MEADMAELPYNHADTSGGKQTAEIMRDLQVMEMRLKTHAAWVLAVRAGGDGSNLEAAASDFNVSTGNGGAFSDTVVQISGHFDDFMTAAREKIERLARGG
jgi:hypothetical protein